MQKADFYLFFLGRLLGRSVERFQIFRSFSRVLGYILQEFLFFRRGSPIYFGDKLFSDIVILTFFLSIDLGHVKRGIFY